MILTSTSHYLVNLVHFAEAGPKKHASDVHVEGDVSPLQVSDLNS